MLQFTTDISEIKELITKKDSLVINVLLYFDVFNYPLLKEEILSFLPHRIFSENEINTSLKVLVAAKYIKTAQGYYFLSGNDISVISRREKGNKLSLKMMKNAKRFSSLIASFPFVRCVCISGSLSKGYMDEKSDIDYFIITHPKRLWIARSFLILFKKIFLVNSHKYFCVNYFIDTQHLEIADKNIFTATELLTLIPMNNPMLFTQFITENQWVKNFLPNYKLSPVINLKPETKGIKPFIEKLFTGKFGEWLDASLMRLTIKRWKHKFPHFKDAEFEQTLRSRRYVSKHHPQNFQQLVLSRFEEKRNLFETKFNLNLHV